MRMNCVLFFVIVLPRACVASAADDDDNYGAVIDTQVVDYDENSEQDYEKSERDRPRQVKKVTDFVGTNLFGVPGSTKKCFSSEDVALLSARRDFESLIPCIPPNCLLDDNLSRILLKYFATVHQLIDKMAVGHVKRSAQNAFYDTLGGYLNYYLIPISKYSFYAGLLKLETVEAVLDLHWQCKSTLNTNGRGWRTPKNDLSDLDVEIEPVKIVIYDDEDDASCPQLNLLDEQSGEDEDMIVPLPRLDPEERGLLGDIWFPFKRKQIFNLQSDKSAFVFLRYFELSTRCYHSQGISSDTFNRRLKVWILENLEVHLFDETLYPGLGAVLRVAETARRNSKGSIIEISRTSQKTKPFLKLQHNANKQKKPPHHWIDDGEDKNNYIFLAIGINILILFVVFMGIGLVIVRRALSGKWNPKQDDEEILINLSPPSRSQGLPGGRHTQQPLKVFRDNRSKNNANNDAAIIETSSMDSDSPRVKKPVEQQEAGSKPKPPKTTRHKDIIVDERKRFSISRKKKLQRVEETRMDRAKKETW